MSDKDQDSIEELSKLLFQSKIIGSSDSLGSAERTTPVEFLGEEASHRASLDKNRMLESRIGNSSPTNESNESYKSLAMMTKQPPQRIGSSNKRKSSDISELIDSDDSAMNTDDELETIQKTKKAKKKEGGKRKTRKKRKKRTRKRRKSRRRKRRRKKRTKRRR